MVPETGIEPVRPLFTKRRILSPMCLPISPLRHGCLLSNKNAPPTEADRAFRPDKSGGAVRSRTGLTGFAIRGITALLPRRLFSFLNLGRGIKKGSRRFPFSELEREKSLELSTSTLARLRSTN